MQSIWFSTILSTLAVSLISLVGVLFLAFNSEKLKHLLFILVSFAVGGLLGNVFFHLLPEAYEQIPCTTNIGILALSGFLVFFVLEKIINHGSQNRVEAKSFGYISLFADSVHNFTDGILIAAGWMAGPEIGLTTTLAVIFHEIPQEISDFGILIHSGISRKKALLFNLLAALFAVVGAVVTLLIGSSIENFSIYILPFAAGGFIYLAASDLIPELHKDKRKMKSFLQLLFIVVGLSMMLLFNGHQH